MNKRSVLVLSVSVCSNLSQAETDMVKMSDSVCFCLILSVSVCLAAVPGEAGSGDGQGQEGHADQKPRQDSGDTG